MAKGTISICFVEALLDGVRQRGFDAGELLAESGISPSLLGLAHARVSAALYTVLVRLVVQTLDDEFFGQDSRRMKVGSFAMLGHAVIHCRTLEKALARALRFFALCLDDLGGELSHSGGMARLVLREAYPDQPARVFAHETILMFVHRLACWLVNRRIPILSADFRYDAPPHVAEYALLFSSKVQFGQPKTALSFDARYLDMPVVRTERALKEFLRIAPENLLVQYKDSHSIGARLRRHLRPLPPEEWPSFEVMAVELGQSPSTLRRRLEAEGQSYQLIKDHLRRDMAINALSETGKSVMEIAADLGFAEPSAFHRAFKKWTGAKPGEYRRRVRATPV